LIQNDEGTIGWLLCSFALSCIAAFSVADGGVVKHDAWRGRGFQASAYKRAWLPVINSCNISEELVQLNTASGMQSLDGASSSS